MHPGLKSLGLEDRGHEPGHAVPGKFGSDVLHDLVVGSLSDVEPLALGDLLESEA